MTGTRPEDLVATRFSRMRSRYLGGGLTRDELVQDCLASFYGAARSPSGVDDLLAAVGSHDVYTDCLLVLAAERKAGLTPPGPQEGVAGDDRLSVVRDQVHARVINPVAGLRLDSDQAVEGGCNDAGDLDEDGVWLAIELVSQMHGPGSRATLDMLGWIAHQRGWLDLAVTAVARLPDFRPDWSPGLQLAMLQSDPRLAGNLGLTLDAALTVAGQDGDWDETALARLNAVAIDLLQGGEPADVNRLTHAALALWRRGAPQEADRLSQLVSSPGSRSGSLTADLWAVDVAPVAALRLRLGHADHARDLALEIQRLSGTWWSAWYGLQSMLIASWVMAETADDPEECLMWCQQILNVDHSSLGPLEVRVNHLKEAAYERQGNRYAAREAEAEAEVLALEGRPLSLHLSEEWALRWLMWDIEKLPLNLRRP